MIGCKINVPHTKTDNTFCVLPIINFLHNHPMNIPAKFSYTWPGGFREE